MAVTSISSRELARSPFRARRATKDGPVFITSRGRLTHVLITFEEYQRVSGNPRSISDSQATPRARRNQD
jgi:PHD/YefM family antitoxin component YafN of YafNO toxin-antitoxin module